MHMINPKNTKQTEQSLKKRLKNHTPFTTKCDYWNFFNTCNLTWKGWLSCIYEDPELSNEKIIIHHIYTKQLVTNLLWRTLWTHQQKKRHLPQCHSCEECGPTPWSERLQIWITNWEFKPYLKIFLFAKAFQQNLVLCLKIRWTVCMACWI